MRHRWIVLIAVPLSLAAIACGGATPAGTGSAITPVVALPPVWTPTPAVALDLPAGWEPLFGSSVELWLPESFEGGDPATRRDELLENLRTLGPGYENLIAALEAGAPGMLFFSYDTGLAGATVGITRRDLPASVALNEYLETYVAELPGVVPGIVILEHGTISLQGEDVGKVKMDITAQGSTSTQVSYVFHRGDNVYTVSYAVPQEFFPEAESAFEVSSNTFRVTQ